MPVFVDGWERWPDIPTARHQGPAVSWGKWIYLFGGGSGSFNEIYRFDCTDKNNSWETLSPMPNTRYGHVAAVIGDYAYLHGGLTSSSVLNSWFWRYHFPSGTWTDLTSTIPPGQVPRYDHGAAVLGGKLYIGGGNYQVGGSTTVLAEMWEFDPGASTWVQKADIPGSPGRTGHAMFASEATGRVHIIHGVKSGSLADGGMSSHEAYNPVSNTYTTLTPPSHILGYGVENGIYKGRGCATPNFLFFTWGRNVSIAYTGEHHSLPVSTWNTSGWTTRKKHTAPAGIGDESGQAEDPSAWVIDGYYTFNEYSGAIHYIGGFRDAHGTTPAYNTKFHWVYGPVTTPLTEPTPVDELNKYVYPAPEALPHVITIDDTRGDVSLQRRLQENFDAIERQCLALGPNPWQ